LDWQGASRPIPVRTLMARHLTPKPRPMLQLRRRRNERQGARRSPGARGWPIADDVRVVESQHKGTTLWSSYVAPDDAGKMNRTQGRTVAALRTLAVNGGERKARR